MLKTNIAPQVESVQPHEPLAEAMDLLRNEVMQSPTNHTVDLAYNIANRVGLGIAATSESSGEAFNLLNYTRAESQPRIKKLTTATEEDAPAGTHNEYWKILTIDHSTILRTDVFRKRLTRKQVELKHDGDIELISFFSVVAHEAGHAALSGVSQLIRRKYSYSGSRHLAATNTYLAHHPEVGFTGNWDTDVAIHEERFAEGYANLVTSEVIRALGYSARDTRKILSSLKHSTDVQGPLNANQLDHLIGITVDATLAEKVVNGNRRQKYPGELGYEKPLTKKQVLEQLKELSGLCKQDEIDAKVDPEDWLKSVKNSQLYRTRHHIKKLQRRRYNALYPDEKAKRVKRTTRGVIGLSALMLVVLGTEIEDGFNVLHLADEGGQMEQAVKSSKYNAAGMDKQGTEITIRAELSDKISPETITKELKKLTELGADTAIVYKWVDNSLVVGVTNKITSPPAQDKEGILINDAINSAAFQNGSIAQQTVAKLIKDTDLAGTAPDISVLDTQQTKSRITTLYQFHNFKHQATTSAYNSTTSTSPLKG